MKQRLSLLRYIVTQGCRYAWQSLKNCVKILLGRKLYRDERLVFYRQCVLHLLRIRPIQGITSIVDSGYEGAGFQALMMMDALNFARVSGLPYLHTPFARIGHANRAMPEWVAAWESLFNFGVGEVASDGSRGDVVNYRYVRPELDLCFGQDSTKGQLAQSFRTMIPEFRRKYYWNKSPRTTNEVIAAVHIRRGDVSAQMHEKLFTANGVVSQTIRDVKSSLDFRGQPYRVHVHSQGNPSDFEDLHALGVEFFLDSDAIWTMQEFIEADILIMARSSFSYYAGIISDGIKIFEPRFVSSEEAAYFPSYDWRILSQADDWVPCGADGAIDRAPFDRQLTLLLQAKEKAKTTGPTLTGQ